MPSRGPNGKERSGHEKRTKAAYGELQPMSKAARAAFAEIGPPPLEDPDVLLRWSRKVLATTTWLVLIGEIDALRARTIQGLVAATGMTHNRASIETRTVKLEAQLAAKQESAAIQWVSGDKLKRPPRAPRSIPPEDLE